MYKVLRRCASAMLALSVTIATGAAAAHEVLYLDEGRVYHGQTWEGEWRAGMRHGEGVEALPGGLSRRCTWRWGEVIRQTCTAGE